MARWILLLSAVALAGLMALFVVRGAGLSWDAPVAAKAQRCATAATEKACRHLRLYRTTTYDAGACAWDGRACRFRQGDGG